ncbi:MAG: Stp1/IreP family PP2C-type Ser/Thr phosphatase [candidate division WOR-3 bacterium]
MQVKVFGKTDIGKVRDHNEDNIFIAQREGIFAVCDGMGGHAGGEIASFYACEVIKDLCIKNSIVIEDSPQDLNIIPEEAHKILMAIRIANQRIYLESAQIPERRGMGTTIALLHLSKTGYAYLVNVGDSRIYRLRNESLEQLTKDHTWMNELLEDKEISEQDIANFRQKNVLTRALGVGPSVKIDIRLEPIKNGDLFLICSDGLSGLVSPEEIKNIIKNSGDDLKTAGEILIETANNKGGNDNISVILVQVDGINENQALTSKSYTIQETDAVIQSLQKLTRKHYKILKKKQPLPIAVAFSITAILILAIFLLLQSGKQSRQKIGISKLVIKSEPTGALIVLNGKEIGNTPFTVDSLTSENSYELKLIKDGFLPYSESIFVKDSIETKFAHLKPIAIVRITYLESKTGEGNLFIDNKNYGKLSEIENRNIAISDGKHWFSIILNDEEIFFKQLIIEKNSIIEIIPDEVEPKKVKIKREEE